MLIISTRSIKMRSVNKKMPIRIAILVVSIVLLVMGLQSGGFRDVKNKAIMICYECIGIG